MNARRRGYPLGALFVMVATCAVLAAGISPLIRSLAKGNVDAMEFLWALGIGAASGLAVGTALGGVRFNEPLPAALGAVAGLVLGAAAGMVTLLPVNQLAPAAAAMTAGCALIVCVALVMRPREL